MSSDSILEKERGMGPEGEREFREISKQGNEERGQKTEKEKTTTTTTTTTIHAPREQWRIQAVPLCRRPTRSDVGTRT